MTEAEKQERVVRFLASTQERLLRYVFVLLPDWDGAQEVVQNTHVVVWKKAKEFESADEESFFRWARQIAFYEVKKYIEQKQKHPTMFEAEILELIRDDMEAVDRDLEHQREALATCIDKLSARDQELLRLRYWNMESIASLSSRLGRKIDSLYKSLQRIRHSLLHCIEREARRIGHL